MGRPGGHTGTAGRHPAAVLLRDGQHQPGRGGNGGAECQLRRTVSAGYGADVFSDTQTAFTDIGLALQAFQQEDPSFNAYTSKYDYATALQLSNGQPVNLTAAENRGYFVFNYTGNCFACHYNGPMTGGGGACSPTLRTRTTGAPRNPNIPANATRIGLPPTTTWACARR